jgi:hypothetical protein
MPLPTIESFLEDVLLAVRTFCKNPGFTAVAVLTLTLVLVPTQRSSASCIAFSSVLFLIRIPAGSYVSFRTN